MENYNLNIINGVHTIKFTLQNGEYKGHLFQKIHGNCKGISILNVDFYSEEIEKIENDCKMEYDEEVGLYSFELKDKDGNILIFDGVSPDEIEDMVVCSEIIDFTEEKIVE